MSPGGLSLAPVAKDRLARPFRACDSWRWPAGFGPVTGFAFAKGHPPGSDLARVKLAQGLGLVALATLFSALGHFPPIVRFWTDDGSCWGVPFHQVIAMNYNPGAQTLWN
jgi:hypothetical protein